MEKETKMIKKRVSPKELVLNPKWSPSDKLGNWPLPILSKEWVGFYRKINRTKKQEIDIDRMLLHYIKTE
jgi:hypothetical protein